MLEEWDVVLRNQRWQIKEKHLPQRHSSEDDLVGWRPSQGRLGRHILKLVGPHEQRILGYSVTPESSSFRITRIEWGHFGSTESITLLELASWFLLRSYNWNPGLLVDTFRENFQFFPLSACVDQTQGEGEPLEKQDPWDFGRKDQESFLWGKRKL